MKNLKTKERKRVEGLPKCLKKALHACQGILLLYLICMPLLGTAINIPHKKRSISGITGSVMSSDGNALKGVAVLVKGSKVQTTTDRNGEFSINTDPGAILVFALEHYTSKEEAVTDGTTKMNVVLNRSIAGAGQQLDPDSSRKDTLEYFNQYYGRQEKRFATGAYAQIYGASVATNPIINNRNRLQGQLPGLFVMQNNGEPGDENASMWLRGKRTFMGNEPVILVDGFERSMALLDPNEIATYTLLKDAAATARYGLRGGNGVLLITTRRGQEGKIKVTLNADAGLKAPTTEPRLLNSFQYASLYNEALVNDGAAPRYSAEELAKYEKSSQGIYENDMDRFLYPSINSYDEYIKPVTWQKRINVNVDGGNKIAQYFVSGGYTTNSGLYNVDKNANTYNTNTNFDMITLRSNVNIAVNKRFSLMLDIAGRQEQRTYPGTRTDAALRIFRALYKTPPNAFPVFTPDGNIAGTKDFTQNAYGLLNSQGYSLYYVRSMFATLRGTHDLDFILPGLKINGSVAFDSWFDQVTNRSKNFKVYDLRQPDGAVAYLPNGKIRYVETGSDTQMSSSIEYPSSRRTFNSDISVDYNRDFGLHSIKVSLMGAQRSIEQEDNGDIPRAYLGTNGRVAYAFNRRYLAEFNFAYQGSEQLLSGNKFGFFPAVSAGWIVSEENFLRNNSLINFLKIRGSHGVTGNDDLGGYFLWYQKYQSAGGSNFGYTSQSYPGWQESAFALNNVTWEKVRKTNVGIDATLLKNKINLSFDYFYERNRDIMIQPALPNIMGIRFPNFPIGVVENKGFDASLSFTENIGDLQFSIGGMITKADNTVLARGEEVQRYAYQSRTGLSLNAMFGLEAMGLFRDQAEIDASPAQTFGRVMPGDIKYKDQNGDQVIDAYDEVYLGNNADPTMQYGTTLSLKFRGFDFNVLFTGQHGGKQNLSGEAAWEFHDNGTVREHHLGRYNPNDETSWSSASYPRLSLSNKANNQRTSSYWLKDASMLRLKSMEIGYTLKNSWLSALKLHNARFYLNGYNLFTWSSTDLVDIEARSSHYVVYPLQRIINGGINVTF